MFSTFVQTALFAVLAARHVAADMVFSTPSLTQCQDAKLSWSEGSGPYYIYVVPSSDSCADSVVDIPKQSGTSYNWKVNVPGDSLIELLVEDSTSDEAWTGVITVANSTDASCVDKKAAEALNAAAPQPSSSAAASSAASSAEAASSGAAATPAVPYSGPAVTVQPAAASAVANAANGEDNTSQSSGSAPRAAISAGSLFTAAALFLSVAHF